jgi:multidrug efflux system membrane fusion protein
MRPIYVTFALPEARLPEIRAALAAGALPVTASVPGAALSAEEGRVTFVDNAVDQTTGMIRLKATFANEQERLWPGQFLGVSLTLRTIPDAVAVPSRAIQTGQGGQYLWVVGKDQAAELRPVTAGVVLDGQAVIEKGLGGGEQVVVDGQLRLVPGARVELKAGLETQAAGPPGATRPAPQ